MTTKINSVQELKEFINTHKGTIGIVPSIGNFHAGHQSLFRKSVEQNDMTIICVVIAPVIFNDYNDYLTYPRSPEQDLIKANETGADVLFAPEPDDFIPGPLKYTVVESDFCNRMEGFNRPAHFDGVLAVVLKELLLIKPDRLYLGEKDYQQLELIRGMCKEFYIPTEIVPCPIIRTESGLAYSSRNSQLTKEQQIQASEFPRILQLPNSIEEIKQQLESTGFAVQYIEEYQGRRYGAVKLGPIRLIDNFEIAKIQQKYAIT